MWSLKKPIGLMSDTSITASSSRLSIRYKYEDEQAIHEVEVGFKTTVSQVLKQINEGHPGSSIWAGSVRLPDDDDIINYFDIDEIFVIRVPKFFEGSMAAAYAGVIHEWIPEMKKTTLLAQHAGSDAASVKAFIAVAIGQTKTFVCVRTGNGNAVFGGYLEPAWVDFDRAANTA
jgi:hypothetical protein